MKNAIISYITIVILIHSGCSGNMENVNYKGNPAPLKQNAYIRLPLGSIKPDGWLRSQLEAQASGLTGNIDDFWPDLSNNAWRGGTGDAWERGPYFLDGLIPLAWSLNDARLKEKVNKWIEPIIASSSDSGWYGPGRNKDRWPLSVANKVMMQYYEATSDERALGVLKKYFSYMHDTRPDWPDNQWRGVRAMENAVSGYWLYRQTGEPWILETIESVWKNSFDWTTYYEKFPWDSSALAEKRIPTETWTGLTAHGVNNGMAIKYPGLWYQQSGDERFKDAVFEGLKKYDLNHGQAGGRFSCDEHLAGKSPDHGTELCAVVEEMFSLEELYEIFGDNSLADRLELLTFNALPGTTTPDYWSHQYDQQSNQVLVTGQKRAWVSNGDYSNIYGLMPNFACCLANMHQGWPKFAGSLWMATNDNGLAAIAYSPCTVNAKVAKGKDVTISEVTDYPFKGSITLKISTSGSIRFPLYLRVPGWTGSVVFNFRGKSETGRPGTTVRLDEKWSDGDEITFSIPLNIRSERRYNNSLSVLRGPLCFSLRIEKEYKSVKINYDNYRYKGSIDWEIYPKSTWNYGILYDFTNPGRGFEVTENKVTEFPFADRGDQVWSADSGKYVVWDKDAAVVINARGIKIPEWKIKDNSADIPPLSPVSAEGIPEVIQLVPYGSARLRITEFPYIEASQVPEIMR
jgi:hypothetical protein